MKQLFFIAAMFGFITGLNAQTTAQQLQKAYDQFLSDAQLEHAISSLYVIDAKTGTPVFDRNSHIGLAPASTQKIVTSVTAFELLGKDFRYNTLFGIVNNNGRRSLYIKPSGDPTLGSWRWENTKEDRAFSRINAALKGKGINDTVAFIDAHGWSSAQVPDGWMWQDIGNYYGAGTMAFNWRENQYDILLKSGSNIGDEVRIVGTRPSLVGYPIESEVVSAAKGTGDNAYIYLPVNSTNAIVRGTIPVNENKFEISGSLVNPALQFLSGLGIAVKSTRTLYLDDRLLRQAEILHTESSPSLDSIIYWFNKRSINLYGEALVRTIAFEKKGLGTTHDGLKILKEFWEKNGIDEDELNMYDGSGLSPLNRVTTHAQVEILKFAKTKSWYTSFFDALPEFNGMKMKSGTISDVKGFCGYHRAKDGREYIFSFLVNNYNGRASTLVNKMYKVLDVLK